jgi:hypothetical protein|eukprot:COSAG06_NODE_2184_length_7394_cov_363.476628_5_plen_99_part_00
MSIMNALSERRGVEFLPSHQRPKAQLDIGENIPEDNLCRELARLWVRQHHVELVLGAEQLVAGPLDRRVGLLEELERRQTDLDLVPVIVLLYPELDLL